MIEEPEVPLESQEESAAEPAEDSAAVPGALLRYVDNTGPTERVFQVGPDCLVGRHDPAVSQPDVDLTDLPDSKYVSRRHARIRHEKGEWFVADLGSGNGTYLYRKGGAMFEKVGEHEVAIHFGDEIVFGSLRFRFEEVSSE